MIKTHDRQGILDYFKKLGMEIKTIEYQGCYFLTEKGQIKSVKIPYKKVVEKDCISIVDNYTQMRKDRYHAFRLVCEFSLYLKYIKKFLQNFKMKLI